MTYSIPCAVANTEGSKIKQISVAKELADAIFAVYANFSVSGLAGGNSEM